MGVRRNGDGERGVSLNGGRFGVGSCGLERLKLWVL